MAPNSKVCVAFYGCGNFAKKTRIPNLLQLNSVKIIAVCDSNMETVQDAAKQFDIPHIYHTDNGGAHEMMNKHDFDVLYSIVPAYVRTDIEATAAKNGIHIFSEKPQAIKMQVANRIDKAIQQAGVISTVGFRERYRPIFQKAREFLMEKKIVHVRFVSYGGLPAKADSAPNTWWADMSKSGGRALDWGVHATDYSRFMTGLNVAKAQAFYCERSSYNTPLSCIFNYYLNNGATMTLNFISTGGSPKDEPWFTVFFEGGCLTIYRYDRIEVNGELFYQADEFDPWLEQDKTFIRAVQTGDSSILQSDYHDGLFSLAPILAGWESSQHNGECIDLDTFMDTT